MVEDLVVSPLKPVGMDKIMFMAIDPVKAKGGVTTANTEKAEVALVLVDPDDTDLGFKVVNPEKTETVLEVNLQNVLTMEALMEELFVSTDEREMLQAVMSPQDIMVVAEATGDLQ